MLSMRSLSTKKRQAIVARSQQVLQERKRHLSFYLGREIKSCNIVSNDKICTDIFLAIVKKLDEEQHERITVHLFLKHDGYGKCGSSLKGLNDQ